MIVSVGVFLEDILGKFGFHRQMVKWIMQCVTSNKFSICLNGESHGYFKGGRGLRQGDPISPYLFTLVMEVFNLLMIKNIEEYDMGIILFVRSSSFLICALLMTY